MGHGSNAAELIPRVVSSLRDEGIHAVACGSAHTLAVGGKPLLSLIIDTSFSKLMDRTQSWAESGFAWLIMSILICSIMFGLRPGTGMTHNLNTGLYFIFGLRSGIGLPSQHISRPSWRRIICYASRPGKAQHSLSLSVTHCNYQWNDVRHLQCR